ncbi:MAG: 1-(5-phosphoribosyl)-5-[(5-phosphoribosylamino)methylideneamino] imidazole-4-carboxamide isomerase [Alphaproteobacteria bacterium]
MRLYPAIDLRGGRVVRLVQGDPERETHFADDPLAQAQIFAAAGFRALHIVNLDAALGEDDRVSAQAIEVICRESKMSLQLGGGIRSAESAARWLALGVKRLIVSTLAVRAPDTFAELCRDHPDSIWVSVDLRGERLVDGGWLDESRLSWPALLARAEEAGAGGLIRTEVLRDGTAEGVDAERVAQFARATRLPVIAAGGIAAIEDLEALHATGVVAGAILGRAIYDGAIDPQRAAALEARWAAPVISAR